jgi:glycosyltransferase involved in cell wall biosynthesis
MRILYAGQSLNNPLGGGELSAKTLVLALAPQNQLEVIGAGPKAKQGELAEGVHFSDYPLSRPRLPAPLMIMRREFEFRVPICRHIEQFDPDLIMLQQPAQMQPFDIDGRKKLLIFVRSLMCFGIGDPSPRMAGRVARAPFQKLRLRRNRPLLERADLIVTNSRFLQHELEIRTGLTSDVIHPFIDTSQFRQRPTRPGADALTFVGLDSWKGAGIALAVAGHLKDRPFLFLEGARSSEAMVRKARRLPNVSVLPWTDNMAQVLEKTRVLLVPSLWEEPFGRLPVEAGACGVPTIASDCGGLSESVGKGGILLKDFHSVATWIDAIEQLDNPKRYRRMSELAKANAEALDAIPMLSRFRDLVADRLGMML